MSDDLSDWMRRLPAAAQDVPVCSLKIPGSHDSFTYSLDPSSPVANSEPSCLQYLASWLPILKRVVYNWSVTQDLTCTQQLTAGIRYFDFRVSCRPSDGALVVVHGQYGCHVTSALHDIHQFLINHSQEVVILDFNHVYGFTAARHHQLMQLIRDTFGTMLCPEMDPQLVTLSFMWSRSYQVVAFYRPIKHMVCPSGIWSSHFISSPWPNIDHTRKLFPILNFLLEHRPAGSFYVTQGVLTPRLGKDIILGLRETLRVCMGVPCTDAVVHWLQLLPTSFCLKLNVVMVDFVQTADLPKAVIDLNFLYCT